jgi:predicted RNA-binding Zn-ribbon protein involved in translation (DUF1610 family)
MTSETEARVYSVGKPMSSMYYRKPDGWIVVGQSHATAFQEYMLRGFVPLSKYGQISAEDGDMSVTEAIERLLTLPGGIEEFPVEQIVAYRWHLDPPIEGLKFPQLDGMEFMSFECPECNCASFSDAATLAKHLRIKHEWQRRDLQVYSEETGINFTPRRGAIRRYKMESRPTGPTVMIATEDATAFKCPHCGERKFGTDRTKMRGHLRFKHRLQGEDLAKAMLRACGEEE